MEQRTEILPSELQELLASCHRFGSQYRMATDYEPALGSQADRELSADHGGEVRRSSSVKDAHARAWMYYYYSEDLLLAMSKVLGDGSSPSLFGPMPLARASLEASARAWWLLEPAIGVEQRRCRDLIERLTNLREEICALGRHVELEEARMKKEALVQRVVRRAAGEGLEVKLTGRTAVRVEGISRPRSSQLIEELLRSTFGDLAPIFFPMLSGGSKGMFFAIGASFEYARLETGQGIGIPRPPGPEDLRIPVYGAALGWLTAFERSVEQFGWDEQMFSSWKRGIWRRVTGSPNGRWVLRTSDTGGIRTA